MRLIFATAIYIYTDNLVPTLRCDLLPVPHWLREYFLIVESNLSLNLLVSMLTIKPQGANPQVKFYGKYFFDKFNSSISNVVRNTGK